MIDEKDTVRYLDWANISAAAVSRSASNSSSSFCLIVSSGRLKEGFLRRAVRLGLDLYVRSFVQSAVQWPFSRHF